MKREVIIIRHGETRMNSEGIFQGEDTPLSDRGNEQAKYVGLRIAKEYGSRVRKVVASNLLRTIETAQHVLDQVHTFRTLNNGTNKVVEFETASILQERSFGDLRGMKISEAMTKFNFNNPDFKPVNGESTNEFDARINEAYGFIRKVALEDLDPNDKDGVVVIVTHGLVKSSLTRNHFDHENPENRVMFLNTSLSIVHINSEKHKADLRLLNCVQHLPSHLINDPVEDAKKLVPKMSKESEERIRKRTFLPTKISKF